MSKCIPKWNNDNYARLEYIMQKQNSFRNFENAPTCSILKRPEKVGERMGYQKKVFSLFPTLLSPKNVFYGRLPNNLSYCLSSSG